MEDYFASLATLSAAVIAITQFIKVSFNIQKDLIIQLISWVAAIGMSLLATWQGWGLFEGHSYYAAAIIGLFVGLLDNGIVKALISIDSRLRENNVDILKFLKRKPPAKTGR